MTKRMAIAGIALVGLFVSIYLTLFKLGLIGEIACSIGSCETVQLSRWATFAGIPVAAWGIGFYVATLALAFVGTTERHADSPRISLALVLLSGWGVLFSAWLTWLELFVIDAICTWCVVSALLVAAIFVAAVLDWRETREIDEQEALRAESGMRNVEGEVDSAGR